MFLFFEGFFNISGFVVFWWLVVLLMVFFLFGWCFISCWFIGFSGFLGFGVFWSFGGLIFKDFINFRGFASSYRCLFAYFGVFCFVVDYITRVVVFFLFLFF